MNHPKSPKKRLKELDNLIEMWENVVKDYPMCFTYKQNLRELKTAREQTAAKIGMKK